MPKDELTVAKINATLKIIEWSKDDIEPGIGGTPGQFYVALAEAFRSVYGILTDAVGPGETHPGASDGADAAQPAENRNGASA